MELNNFIERVKAQPTEIEFEHSMAAIEANYQFTPTAFSNGNARNQADENNGSCKIFAFAQLNGLNETQTLALFGRFYRQDVLQNPEGEDHQNIRNFIAHGWQGVKFEGKALTEK